jgi:TonB-dependent starch-binding outer membrane protein SusC
MQDLGLCKVQVIAWAKPKLTPAANKSGAGKQILRIMKLTAIIILTACLQVSAKGYSQKITLSVKDAPLEQVFKSIEKQSGFYFNYVHEMIKKAQPVTIEVKDATLEEVLVTCFKGQPLDYTVVGGDKIVIIKERKLLVFGDADKQAFPPIDIRGKVVDENGKPVPGVTVTVIGTKKLTITNENGEFSLAGVESNAALSFSSVNMEPFSINVSGHNEILARLKTKTSELDEVQIIAYGQTTKRFQTGNVSTVKATDIEKQPVNNALLVLQGRVPGLLITQTNGLPGGGVTARIQGRNSIGFGNDPLYIIDGVPYFSQLPSTGVDGILGGSGGMVGNNANGNPLNYLNAGDIESISVLKDADATAIYGSRAANGAILITTKKGKAGQMKLELTGQTGWGQVAKRMEMLNTRQYLDMRYEALKNDGINLATQSKTNSRYYDLLVWDTTQDTDWQKFLIGNTAKNNILSATVSGGSNGMQYLVSGNYRKETSVFPGDFQDEKASMHFNMNSVSADQKFSLQFSGNYMLDNNKLPATDLTRRALFTEPLAPSIHNEDGILNWAPNSLGNSTWTNPLADLLRRYKNKTSNLVSNLMLQYQILSGLKISSSLGYTYLQTNDFAPTPLVYFKPEVRGTTMREAQYGDRDLNSWVFEPQITYIKTIRSAKIDALVGATLQRNISESRTFVGLGFNSDEGLENINAANQIVAGGQYSADYKYAALFARINYNVHEKYIFNLTGRRDGTSRFGVKNQFHNFGSVGAAWIFSQERFIQGQKMISFGKIRGSYGTTGSDQIGDYTFMSLYYYWDPAALPYQNTTGIFPAGLSNPYLEWEETKKLQGGIDLGFFKDRVIITGTYSQNRSSNQLLRYSLPTITGNPGIYTNFPAVVQNTSWEFTLATINIKKKNLSWTSNINFTIPRNKLVSFPNIKESIYASGFGGVIIGQPIGVIKTLASGGVDPSTGKYQYADAKGNTVFSPVFPDDYLVTINTTPKFYGGFQNEFSYKGIEVTLLLQYVKQIAFTNSKSNGILLPGQFVSGQSNQPITILERWQKPGDITNVGRFTTTTNGFRATDELYTDASFLRLRNLFIGYNILGRVQRLLHVKNCKVYMQGHNLFTITQWKGLDPETKSNGSLPLLRSWAIGLKVQI